MDFQDLLNLEKTEFKKRIYLMKEEVIKSIAEELLFSELQKIHESKSDILTMLLLCLILK